MAVLTLPPSSLSRFHAARRSRNARVACLGDSTVAGIAGSQDYRGNGGGSYPEQLRDRFGAESFGPGSFPIWRNEWTSRTGFAPITAASTNAANDRGLFGGTGTSADGAVIHGGAYECTSGSASNILVWSKPTAPAWLAHYPTITHVEIVWLDWSGYGTFSYSIDGGVTWALITGRTGPPTAVVRRTKIAIPGTLTSVQIRAADIATPTPNGVACAIVDLVVYTRDPDSGVGVTINNFGCPGANIGELVHTGAGQPFRYLWDLDPALLILGPFTNEPGTGTTFLDRLTTLVRAFRTRTAAGCTVSGTGTSVLWPTGDLDPIADVGKPVTIPGATGATITAVADATHCTISSPATLGSGVTMTITAPAEPDIIVIAQFLQMQPKTWANVTITGGSTTISGPAGSFVTPDDINRTLQPVAATTTLPGVPAGQRISAILSDTSARTLGVATQPTNSANNGASRVTNVTSTGRTVTQSQTLRDQATAVATAWGLPLVDMGQAWFATGELNKANGKLYDALHPTADGYADEAGYVWSALAEPVATSASDFDSATLDFDDTGIGFAGEPPPPPPPPVYVAPLVHERRPRWLLEVRDGNLARVCEVDDYSRLELITRWNAVGSWSLTLPTDTLAADLLVRPRAGIVVERDSVPVFSGLVRSHDRARVGELRTLTVSGPDDMGLLAGRICSPEPGTSSPPYSTSVYDTFSGQASSAIAHYIDGNAGPGAIPARRYPNLVLAPDPAIGGTISTRARFGNLLAKVRQIALASSPPLTVSAVQVGTEIVVSIAAERDVRASVVFSIGGGTLGDYEYGEAAGEANYLYGAGQGAGTARTIVEEHDATSVAQWGRIEAFYDSRDSADAAELLKAVEAQLAETADDRRLELEVIDTGGLSWPDDYALGYRVGVILDGITLAETVRELAITLEGDTETVVPSVGSALFTDPNESRLFALARRLRRRIDQLEALT